MSLISFQPPTVFCLVVAQIRVCVGVWLWLKITQRGFFVFAVHAVLRFHLRFCCWFTH